MRCGLIARAESRGLGHLCLDFYRHMAPDRTLVIDMGALAGGFSSHFDRYPGARIAAFSAGVLDPAVVRPWLDGLDVLLTAETFYDPRVLEWARSAGVCTAMMCMPEFYRPEHRPDVVWAPTRWRMDLLPDDAIVVPVPHAAPPLQLPLEPYDGPLRVLHVAGHRAAMDRNGTSLFAAALLRLQGPMSVTVVCQDRRLPTMRAGRGVTLKVVLGSTLSRDEMYADHDLMVLPRRYGGLSLVAQEAMGYGLGLVMPRCPPNDEWPTWAVDGRWQGSLATPGGEVGLFNTDPRSLVEAINTLSRDRAALDALRQASATWAAQHSWQALAPTYRQRLAEAAGLA